jgi:hypothetical protein
MSLRDDLQMRLNHYRDGNHKAIEIDADECEQLIAELAPATGETKCLVLNPMSQTPERWPVSVYGPVIKSATVLDRNEWVYDRSHADWWDSCFGWRCPDAEPVADLVPRAELDAARERVTKLQADAEAIYEACYAVAFENDGRPPSRVRCVYCRLCTAEAKPDTELVHDDDCPFGKEHPGAIPLADLRKRVAVLEGALRHYAECSEGCTCGDGWSHDVAKMALSETARQS